MTISGIRLGTWLLVVIAAELFFGLIWVNVHLTYIHDQLANQLNDLHGTLKELREKVRPVGYS